jgi:F0F1-type ATP synthase delta subunit
MSLSRTIAKALYTQKTTEGDVVSLLTKYNMLSLLPSIVKELKQFSLQGNKQDTLLIEAPFDLDVSAISKIKRIAGNDLASHEISINKNLLSGFRARFKGVLYDGSADRIIKQFLKN